MSGACLSGMTKLPECYVMPDLKIEAKVNGRAVRKSVKPFARAFEDGGLGVRESFATYVRSAELAHILGLDVNAGHDLDLHNLVMFRELPHLAEVSIGHALISHALFVGLEQSVREYLQVLSA